MYHASDQAELDGRVVLRLCDVRADTTVRMLGDFELIVEGISIDRWKAGRARELLQFLLANQGRPLSRYDLIDSVWEDSDARAPENALKVAIHALRKLLSDAHKDGTRGGQGDPCIQILSVGSDSS